MNNAASDTCHTKRSWLILLDPNESLYLNHLLDEWADCFYRIETKCLRIGKIDGYDEEIDGLIVQSIDLLSEFNSRIIFSLERGTRKAERIINENDKFILFKKRKLTLIDNLKLVARFMRFYSNLVASKVKYFFFREDQFDSLNLPFLKLSKDLVFAGYALNDTLLCLDDNGNLFEKLKIYVCKHYYLQNMIYSFIFDKEKRSGVFINYAYNKNLFNKVNYTIKFELQKLLEGDGATLKLFCSKISYLIAEIYNDKLIIDTNQNYESYYNNNKTILSTINKPDCYDRLYNTLRLEDIHVEPLTFHLSDVLWKINGMLKVENNFLSPKERKYYDKKNLEILHKYAENYLEKANDMYSKGKINYLTLYDAVSSLMRKDKLYENIFIVHKIQDVISTFAKIKKCKGEQKTIFKSNNIVPNNFAQSLKAVLPTPKLEHIIEVFDSKNLLTLFSIYCDKIIKSEPRYIDEKTQYVGIYKSGITLAHIFNLLTKQKKPIWLFNTRPYVATHPIHDDHAGDCKRNVEKIILFDESVKTGYTYSLYDLYMLRNMNDHDADVFFYTIFDFLDYKKVERLITKKYTSVIKYKKDEKISIPEQEHLTNTTSTYCKDGITYERKNIIDIIDNILTQQTTKNNAIDKPKRVDLSFLLCDTDTLFTICDDFANQIHEKAPNDRPVVLFAPLFNASILASITSFILKIKYELKAKIISEGNHLNSSTNNSYLVGIDLSLVSGFTMIYNWKVKQHKKFNTNENIDEGLKEFDLICIVFNGYSESSKNIFSLYQTKENRSNNV